MADDYKCRNCCSPEWLLIVDTDLKACVECGEIAGCNFTPRRSQPVEPKRLPTAAGLWKNLDTSDEILITNTDRSGGLSWSGMRAHHSWDSVQCTTWKTLGELCRAMRLEPGRYVPATPPIVREAEPTVADVAKKLRLHASWLREERGGRPICAEEDEGLPTAGSLYVHALKTIADHRQRISALEEENRRLLRRLESEHYA